jgi:dienelactone hydrolase
VGGPRRALAAAVGVIGAALAAAAAASTFVGTYRLPATAEPVPIQVELRGASAVVSLGPGHAGRQTVRARGLDFTLPGGVHLADGIVTQGRLRGTVSLHAGQDRVLPALGVYRSRGARGVAIVQAQGLAPWLVELPSGDVHGLNATLTRAGRRVGDTDAIPVSVTAAAVRFRGVRYTRIPLRQREVRVGALAATLSLPPGRGPFPSVVMTHGSGPHGREEFQVFAAYCALLGVAVIADDKRGVGESGGAYPGEAATGRALNVLARDAAAEARYLRTLPEVDRTRIGVLGDSQAGWVIALAAAHERLFRWAVPLVGPTTTVNETDVFATLAGKGEAPPSESRAAMTAEARRARSGFDPVPYLRRLHIPVHWVFADDDRNVPTELCVARLRGLRAGHRFGWTVVHATHTLFDLPSGLNVEIPRSRGFARGLFPAVTRFLSSERIVRAR